MAEILEQNKCPARTLFIGVGGIGSKIIRMVADKCENTDTTNLRFVVMDTDVNDLRKLRDGARVNITTIQTSSTQTVGAYLNYDADASQHWFPKNSILYSKTVSEGAGQVRAISRLALNATIRQGNIKPLYNAIDELFAKDGRDLKQALRIYICSTSAGGTGSGLAMGVSMLIRRYLNQNYPESNCMIRGLLLLPGVLETVIESETERNSIRRNGYATIKEINAFMMKGSGFFDVDSRLKRFKNLSVTFPVLDNKNEELASLPFDFCFLLDRLDLNQGSMKHLSQYMDYAAQSLFEQNIGPMQNKAFSKEDNIIKEIADKQNLGRNRFGAIGAAVMQYPYEKIADYVAYSWAIEQIGGEKSASGWLKYDREFARQRAEYKKYGSAREAAPERGDVYLETLKNDAGKLSSQLRRQYLGGDEVEAVNDYISEQIDDYFVSLNTELKSRLMGQTDYKESYDSVRSLTSKAHFENLQNRGSYKSHFGRIDGYAAVAKKIASSIGKSTATSIFWNDEGRLSNNAEDYSVESLLKAEKGGMHPNAVRAYLYQLQKEFRTRTQEAKSRESDCARAILEYQPTTKSKRYKLLLDGSRGDEQVDRSINDVLMEEARYKNAKKRVQKKLAPNYGANGRLAKLAIPYINSVDDYAENALYAEAYDIGLNYIAKMCSAYEKFFDKFESKCKTIRVTQEDLEKELEFANGDSVMRVCCKKEMLVEIVEKCKQSIDDLLPEDLNANIYNTLKSNIIFERDMETDTSMEDRRVDVFDKELVAYFKKSVRDNCGDILDKNILEAIKWECELIALIEDQKKWQQLDGSDEDKPSAVALEKEFVNKYIEERIAEGKRLASPGISMVTFTEPREVSECAFNEGMKESRTLKITDFLSSDAGASKTVSKYELHFFEALYNITPDKLARFAASKRGETGDNVEGIYHRAYEEYMKGVGPDSTKSMVISPHIDKRWDTIAVLPEIDLAGQEVEIKRIHTALFYGLLYGLIKRHQLTTYSEKKIYQLEDENGDLRDMTVSNGSVCDEFYEVLDSLYRDRKAVETILSVAEKYRARDQERRTAFDQTEFNRRVSVLELDFDDDNPSNGQESAFSIPMLYCSSLPNSKRDNNELILMIDSIVDAFTLELNVFDRETDREAHLVKLMKEQFELLRKNYSEMLDKFVQDAAVSNEYEDNDIVIWIRRKLKELAEHMPSKEDAEAQAEEAVDEAEFANEEPKKDDEEPSEDAEE
jgi:hypothetical protein